METTSRVLPTAQINLTHDVGTWQAELDINEINNNIYTGMRAVPGMYGNYFSSYKIMDNFGTPYEAS
jgi:hypothetical protein